jgi:hypothetical protein
MNRKTIFAFGAFLLLSVIAFVALRAPEKGERRGDKPRPMAKINPLDYDTLAVTRNKQTTVLQRDKGKFTVTSPVSYPADESAAKAAFEAVEKLDFGDVVTDQKAKQTEFEVGDDGLRIAAKKGATVLGELIIGKALGAGTMVRVPGKDEIWQANGSIRFTFDKSDTDWRDKSITTFTAADAEKIDIKSKTGGTIELKRAAKKADDKAAGANDEWTVATSSVPIPKLDTTAAGSMLSALASWKTNEFGDNVKPDVSSLGDPALTITVTLKGGKKVTALIGNKKTDDEFYVKTGESPQVFIVKKWAVEHINKRPIDFRDKTICDIDASALTEVAVTHGAESYTIVKNGKDWKATKPAKTELDPAKVTPIAGAFKAWKATGFADDPSSLKAGGLVKPQATILAKSKAATCTLKIGDESKDKQSYFVQAGNAPDVFTVAKWSADRILVKVNDIKKTTVAGK